MFELQLILGTQYRVPGLERVASNMSDAYVMVCHPTVGDTSSTGHAGDIPTPVRVHTRADIQQVLEQKGFKWPGFWDGKKPIQAGDHCLWQDFKKKKAGGAVHT